MKKLHILMPSLLATACAPLVGIVSCNKGDIVPTRITLDKTEATIKVSESIQLTATIEPEGASGNITWVSSDDSIAVVSNEGKVTGLKKGSVTIAAQLDGYNLYAACAITVTNLDPAEESIIIEGLVGGQYEANFYDGGQTDQFSTYLLRGQEKIDISSEAIFHFNLGDQLSYDDTNKCINWSKELFPGQHNVEVVVEYWSLFSQPVSFTINVKNNGSLRIEGLPPGTAEIPITPGESGAWPITLWYDFSNNKEPINVTTIADVSIQNDDMGWDPTGYIVWGEHFDFGGEVVTYSTIDVDLGSAHTQCEFFIRKVEDPQKDPWLQCEGLSQGDEFYAEPNVGGAIEEITFWYYDDIPGHGAVDVSFDVDVTIYLGDDECEFLHWSPDLSSIYWDNISEGWYDLKLIAIYETPDSEQLKFECSFTIECQ